LLALQIDKRKEEYSLVPSTQGTNPSSIYSTADGTSLFLSSPHFGVVPTH
jgi:hypothetical protein